MPGFSNNVADYPFSSMGIYIGNQEDRRVLIDQDFILGSINENKKDKAIKAYVEMVLEKGEAGTNQKLRKYLEEFKKEQNEYKSYRTILFRDKNPDEIILKIAQLYGFDDTKEIMHRWKRNSMKLREVVAYTLAIFCGMGSKEACEYMKNISGTCLARLREKGFKHFKNDNELIKLIIV